MKEIIIDCDTGVDDAIAIAMALSEKELDVVGISTVFGNTSLEQTTKNTLKVLEFLENSAVPVYSGNEKPFKKPAQPFPVSVHGSDGLGNSDLPEPKITAKSNAVDIIAEKINSGGKQLIIIALGPLTNIAQLVPKINKDKLKEIVLMNGVFWQAGNTGQFAEFNAYSDPDAAKIVYESQIPIRAVGLDVTNKISLTKKQFEEIKGLDSNNAELFIRLYDALVQKLNRYSYAFLWDPVAMAWLIDESLVEFKTGAVEVTTEGSKLGQTVFKEGEGNIKVASDINKGQFLDYLFAFLKG